MATDQKRVRCLSAWNSGEASLAEIARTFAVSSTTLRGWVLEWLASGETSRPLRPKSTHTSRTGRI